MIPIRRVSPVLVGTLLLLAIMVSAPPAATAHIWIVDPGGGGEATTIAGAVALAAPGDTIRITSGTYAEVVTAPAPMSFIALGSPVNWQGDGSHSCLTMTGAGFLCRVEGIAFSGGGGAQGGGLQLTGISGGVTIASCTFTGMTVSDWGGGVYADSSPLVVEDCSFESCTASYHNGGGLYAHSAGCTIRRSSFIDCTGWNGGGVNAFECTGTIEGCHFEGCQANEYGGALLPYASPTMEIVSCEFIDNDVPGYNGSTIATWGGATVRDCLFHGNQRTVIARVYAGPLQIVSNTFYGNGTAIYSPDASGDLVVDRNIFSRCDSAVQAMAPPTAVTCNDFWETIPGCDAPDEDGNISLDPQLCDPQNGNYDLAEVSPCAEANVPAGCHQMGAFDIGCGASPIRSASWGTIRLMYR